MDERTNLDRLSERVSQIIQEYNTVKSENETLRNELTILKAQKDQEVEKLKEENAVKDLEIEEIVNKIESMLGQ
ncbi:MAG: hypothetical protein U9Q40_00970 [Campylobacterota bacterium]|nr:hypothetical protein [Campylobacterota bacterium]